MKIVVYVSGDIGDVFVKTECRVYSDTEVFDMIGVCNLLVVNDDRCGLMRKRKYIVE